MKFLEGLTPNFENWGMVAIGFGIFFVFSIVLFLLERSWYHGDSFADIVKEYFSATWETLPLLEYPLIILSIYFTVRILASVQISLAIVYMILSTIFLLKRISDK